MVCENVVYQGDFSITDINGDVNVKKKNESTSCDVNITEYLMFQKVILTTLHLT